MGIKRETLKFFQTRAKPVFSKASRNPSLCSDVRGFHANRWEKSGMTPAIQILSSFTFVLRAAILAAFIPTCPQLGATWYNEFNPF